MVARAGIFQFYLNCLNPVENRLWPSDLVDSFSSRQNMTPVLTLAFLEGLQRDALEIFPEIVCERDREEAEIKIYSLSSKECLVFRF